MYKGEGKKIVVVGAGAVGLSTAVCIQDLLPKASVTIVADKFNTETTSDGAPAIFGPNASRLPGMTPELYRNLCQGSAQWFQKRCYAEDAAESGIFLSSGYYLQDTEDGQFPAFSEYVPSCRPLTELELNSLPSNPTDGFFITTYMIECRRYLPYLMKRFKSNGGMVLTKKIHQVSELSDYDAVVLCTGLGSRELVGDKGVVPVRGQTMRLKAPWLKHFYVTGGAIAAMPCYDTLFVGVTRQPGDNNLLPTEEDRKYIWDGVTKLLPSLKGCEVETEWVGLRPWREAGIRLEKGNMWSGNKKMNIIYNYGHGSNGVGLSWGSALVAAKLTLDSFAQSSSKL